MLGLRCGLSHLVTDKSIQNFAESGENGFELFSDVRCLMYSFKSDRGHGGILTNPTAMMCRRCHRNARRLGGASHKGNIGIVTKSNTAAVATGLYAAPMREDRRSPRFPMQSYASSDRQLLTGANGGDARWPT